MKIKTLLALLPKLIRYNLKIIFAGKFGWFLLAAFAIFAFFTVQKVWMRVEVNEGLVYGQLLFPGLLLIFYPSVFGIQNDEDNRMLEILFGIPDYKYKVWGVRLLMIYAAIYLVLVLFACVARLLLYPVFPFGMAGQLMLPVLFFGNLAFLLSTITRSGNGTAVLIILLAIALLVGVGSSGLDRSYWNPFLNPYQAPDDFQPVLWQSTVLKNRFLLLGGAVLWMLLGLLNLQKRERFV